MQPSYVGEECHKHLCSECIVLFKAFQQKSWNSYAAGVLEVLTPMLTNNDFFIVHIFLPTCLYPPECCLIYLDCKVFWDPVLFTSFTQFLVQWGLDQWVVLLSVTGITDKDSDKKNSSSPSSSNTAVPVFDKLFGVGVGRKDHFLRTVGKNHLQDLSIVWMQGTRRQVSIWRSCLGYKSDWQSEESCCQ